MKSKRVTVARRIHRYLAPRGHVDALAGTRVAGWALGRGPLAVEAWLDERCIARAHPAIARPDVAHAKRGYSGR